MINSEIKNDAFFKSTSDGEKVPIEIKIPESWPRISHYYANIMNRGFIKLYENPLTEEQIIFSNLPSAMFILMPCMGVIFFLLYKKKQLFYSYHLITVLHFHSFVFLIFMLENITEIAVPILFPIFKLIFLGYSLFMLKRIYQDSWIKSSMKFTVIFLIYGITVVLTMLTLAFGKVFILGYTS